MAERTQEVGMGEREQQAAAELAQRLDEISQNPGTALYGGERITLSLSAAALRTLSAQLERCRHTLTLIAEACEELAEDWSTVDQEFVSPTPVMFATETAKRAREALEDNDS